MALLLVYAHGFVAGNAVGNQLCIQLERQPSGAHAGFFQFFGKVFPRMDRDDCRHRVLRRIKRHPEAHSWRPERVVLGKLLADAFHRVPTGSPDLLLR